MEERRTITFPLQSPRTQTVAVAPRPAAPESGIPEALTTYGPPEENPLRAAQRLCGILSGVRPLHLSEQESLRRAAESLGMSPERRTSPRSICDGLAAASWIPSRTTTAPTHPPPSALGPPTYPKRIGPLVEGIADITGTIFPTASSENMLLGWESILDEVVFPAASATQGDVRAFVAEIHYHLRVIRQVGFKIEEWNLLAALEDATEGCNCVCGTMFVLAACEAVGYFPGEIVGAMGPAHLFVMHVATGKPSRRRSNVAPSGCPPKRSAGNWEWCAL